MTSKNPAWGDTRETIAAWCALPIAWNRSKPGYRKPPRLIEGDARKITLICWPELPDIDSGDDQDILDLAGNLDTAYDALDDAKADGDGEAISDALETIAGCVEEWYDALRLALHPDQVAAEAAELAKIMAMPLTGLV